MPENPARYYQSDNAGFQVGLTDLRLTVCLIHLAKKQFGEQQLASAQTTLRMAQRIAPEFHAIRSLDIEELSADSDFDSYVGGGR